jgi:hypothetical protein
LLNVRKDLIAPLRVLPALLEIVQPERRVNTYEHKDKFRRPATDV